MPRREFLRFQWPLRQKCVQVLVVSFGHQAYCPSIAADVQETQDVRMRQQSGEHGKFAECMLRLREAPSLDGHVRPCAFLHSCVHLSIFSYINIAAHYPYINILIY